MASYPSLVIATRLVPVLDHPHAWRFAVAGLGAVIMTAWDLVMDPMMVAGGHWVWEVEGAYFGIPLQNFAGWWLTVFVVFLLFLYLVKGTSENLAAPDRLFERQPILIYAILGLSSVAVTLKINLGGPALVGLFAMGPWVLLGWRHPARR
jgi:putative membrane protein